jgi:hypothetical protein
MPVAPGMEVILGVLEMHFGLARITSKEVVFVREDC